jgi:hypothetical protein
MIFLPTETVWTLRDSADTLITCQFHGIFCSNSGAVSKTAYLAEGVYTFKLTKTDGYRVCCQYNAGEFKITLNGEPAAITSSGEFRDAVGKSFDVVGHSTGPTVGTRECGYQFPIGWVIGLEHVGYVEYIPGYDTETQADDAVL